MVLGCGLVGVVSGCGLGLWSWDKLGDRWKTVISLPVMFCGRL